MNILFLTHNSSLRSTTCVLDALINLEYGKSITPTLVFPNEGPWQKTLSKKGIKTYIRKFIATDFKKPVVSIIEVFFWINVIRKNNIDLIHVNEHDNYPVIRLIAWLTRRPIVVGVRFVINSGFASWAFGGRFLPERLLFTSQDQLTRSEIPAFIPKRNVMLFGNGRDLKEMVNIPDNRSSFRLQHGIGDEEILIGTASVIRRRKKIEDLIVLVEELRNKGYPIKGFIAGGGKFGDPNYYKELEDLVVEKKLTDKVIMLGNLEELGSFYQSLDIFVSTSELETFGMSVCEAMAFNKPIVAYEGGSVQEVINDPSCIVPTGDQDALLAKTLNFIKDPTLRETIAIKGQKRVFEMYDAPVLASRLLKIYKEVAR
jgi:glycosyltransferase involved in cell wall biosynthesis